MAEHSNPFYSPYGAYELKAKYQRNMFFATSITTGLVALVVLTFWLVSDTQAKDNGTTTCGLPSTLEFPHPTPPPKVISDVPRIKKPGSVKPSSVITGIPKPFPDEEIIDDNEAVLSGNFDPVDLEVGSEPTGGNGSHVDTEGYEIYPAIDSFVPVEIMPEMIYEVAPEYPRLAKQAGFDGTVWIRVLVSTEGRVLEEVVSRSSENELLDAAALGVARLNRFKPGIQNGRPIAVWVTYTVDFVLTN